MAQIGSQRQTGHKISFFVKNFYLLGKYKVKVVEMPQIERRNNIRDILIWLRDTEAKVTLAKLLTFIRVEATDMGCTERTARSYIEDCSRYKLIEYKGNPPRWRITNIGKKWLARRGF